MRVTIAPFALQFGVSAMVADLVAAAAAGLAGGFADVGHEFERARPGTKVAFNFAGSGQLLRPIAKGAPVDVDAFTDRETLDKAEGLVAAGTRVDSAHDLPIVTIDSTSSVASLHDQTKRESCQSAVDYPESMPVGRYSRAVPKRLGT